MMTKVENIKGGKIASFDKQNGVIKLTLNLIVTEELQLANNRITLVINFILII